MCLNCLNKVLMDIKLETNHAEHHLEVSFDNECENCIRYYKEEIKIFKHMKLLCELTLKKQNNTGLDNLSKEVSKRIKEMLNALIEFDDVCDETEYAYLERCNHVKYMYDMFSSIEEADKR